MQTWKITRKTSVLFALLTAFLFPLPQTTAGSMAEQHFDTLTIGTQTYSNVTVTTRNKSYVFLLHSAGMMNVKVSDLSSEEKQILGYEAPKPATNHAVGWAKAALKKIETPEVKKIEQNLKQNLQEGKAPNLAGALKPLSAGVSTSILALVLALIGAFYFFMCYCSMLICKKAGTEPGLLVWLPVLQMFPLLRAAGMSPLWFVAMVLPVLNIVAHLVWCIKIAKARGKSFWTAICLILPFTSFFAFLYLAFSNSVEEVERETKEKPGMMVLSAT